jgi:hypothetical protein
MMFSSESQKWFLVYMSINAEIKKLMILKKPSKKFLIGI